MNEMKIESERLLALAGDDRELVIEIVKDFSQDSVKLLEQMREALSEENHDILKQSLHQLKGSSGTLGMVTLFEKCRDWEAESSASWTKVGQVRLRELEDGIRASVQLARNCLAG